MVIYSRFGIRALGRGLDFGCDFTPVTAAEIKLVERTVLRNATVS